MEVNLEQLPIPDWGLTCPYCEYELRGLPSHRCPECGRELVMDEVVKIHHRVREPLHTGTESPLPDYGILCKNCDEPLVGSVGGTCHNCAALFDPERLRPKTEWFEPPMWATRGIPRRVVPVILADEFIPHRVRQDEGLSVIVGQEIGGSLRIRIHRDFFFDFLHAMQAERLRLDEVRAQSGETWICPDCQADNPGNFIQCWQCENYREE